MKKITLLFISKNDFIAICELFANNKIILGICSITSLIGFVMTIYVTIKTKSIDKKMLEYKLIQHFNRKRSQYINTLQSYQTSLLEDDVDIDKIKTNILNDINIIYESYSYIFKLSQKFTIYRLRKELEKSEGLDTNYICNLLSKVIAYLSKNKEN